MATFTHRERAMLEDASQIVLPPPFDQWLFGGMNRFAMNVRYLYKRLGGEIPGVE